MVAVRGKLRTAHAFGLRKEVLFRRAIVLSQSNQKFLIFRTDLFLYDQEDDQLDAWFVGSDCAGWKTGVGGT